MTFLIIDKPCDESFVLFRHFDYCLSRHDRYARELYTLSNIFELISPAKISGELSKLPARANPCRDSERVSW